jgi:uncharacterized membrane protein
MWGLDALPPQTAVSAMQAMNASVPMNQALARIDPASPEAAAIWVGHSGAWQFWNQTWTMASGVSAGRFGPFPRA